MWEKLLVNVTSVKNWFLGFICYMFYLERVEYDQFILISGALIGIRLYGQIKNGYGPQHVKGVEYGKN